MSVLVFLDAPDPQGFVGDPNPEDAFLIHVPAKLFNSSGPQTATNTAEVTIPSGSTPSQVCDMLYQAAKDLCSAISWPEPSRQDVHMISCVVNMPEPTVF